MQKHTKCDCCDVPATYIEKTKDYWRWYCGEHARIHFGNDPQWRKVLEKKGIVVPCDGSFLNHS